MNNLRLPFFWKGMGHVNQAAYLCSTFQAKDYPHACSILSKMKPRRKKPAVKTPPQNIRLPYADS